jgi:pyruvate ferredoxin oxidoreductase gamma subunit
MFQVRMHGRGGQGVATTAELLSVAAFCEDRFAQAMPTFDTGLTGFDTGRGRAPVTASCRISEQPIRTREPVTRPDAVIISDPALLPTADMLAGLGCEGYLLINSGHGLDELGMAERLQHFHRDRLLVIPATRIAFGHLGQPMPGAALLGALAAATGRISLESVVTAIREWLPAVADGNVAAAREAAALVPTEHTALAVA